jgi:integrase
LNRFDRPSAIRLASRLTAAGVSPLTIARMLGHSSTQIVPRYAQVMDQNRLDAMKKLEDLKKSATAGQGVVESPTDETVQGIPQ